MPTYSIHHDGGLIKPAEASIHSGPPVNPYTHASKTQSASRTEGAGKNLKRVPRNVDKQSPQKGDGVSGEFFESSILNELEAGTRKWLVAL